MFKILPRCLVAAQNSSIGLYEPSLSLLKDNKIVASAFTFASQGGGRTFSTSSGRVCEKKNNVASSDQEEKTNGDERPGSTASVERDQKNGITFAANQAVESVTVDGSATKQEEDVKMEQLKVTPKQVTPNVAKSGKEGLLDILGAMKVEVTNKRKRPNVSFRQSDPPASTPKPSMDSTVSMFQQSTAEAASQRETLDPKLVAAASAAARTFPNSRQAESELLKKLRKHENVTEAQKKGGVNNLGGIIADMKVGKTSNRKNSWAINQIRFDDDGQGFTRDRNLPAGSPRGSVIFSGRRLNIFPATPDKEEVEAAVARPTLWDIDFAAKLSSATTQMPRNSLEEMIQWTREGKMWQYPINNEDGLDEEANVTFHDHVFLDKHLEEGFPRQGPIRQFMELVVAGLSKNPYLTVQQKKEHILWFRDYFHEKQAILSEADVYLQ